MKHPFVPIAYVCAIVSYLSLIACCTVLGLSPNAYAVVGGISAGIALVSAGYLILRP